MAIRHRAIVGAVSALVVIGGLLAGAAPANALPRQCDRLYRVADTHWGYAEAEYAVGDYAAYDAWMNVYDHDVANIIASGC
jgi:hypothetical protein